MEGKAPTDQNAGMAKYLAGAITLVLLIGGGAYLWMYGYIGDTGGPQSLLVQHQGETIQMTPLSYCWATGTLGVCADGVLEFPSEADALLNTESAPARKIDSMFFSCVRRLTMFTSGLSRRQ